MSRRDLPALLFAMVIGTMPVAAQQPSTSAPAPATVEAQSAPVAEEPREGVKIGLSSETIEIATDFTGTDLTIFGSLDNPRIETLRGGGYDVVVVLEGPPRKITVREKKRIAGIWINADSFTFRDVPKSYLVATTRAIRDIAPEKVFSQLSLGISARYLPPLDEAPEARIAHFDAAFRGIQAEAGLYNEREAGVRFISQNLFKASLKLPASIPLGTHRARAFLFKEGQFLAEDSAQLFITKDSFEQTVYETAQNNGLLYGLAAVLLAMATGWAGRLMFRRD